MGQSIVKNDLHIIFSTNYRQPIIDERIEKELHSYLGGICNEFKGFLKKYDVVYDVRYVWD